MTQTTTTTFLFHYDLSIFNHEVLSKAQKKGGEKSGGGSKGSALSVCAGIVLPHIFFFFFLWGGAVLGEEGVKGYSRSFGGE